MNVPAALLAVLTVFSVGSAVVLVRAAFAKPRIGALVERAAVAVLIAFFGCVYTIVALDTEAGRVVFSSDVARIVTRTAVVALLALPTVWSALYLTGRLGGYVCAVQTEAYGRCTIPGAATYHVRGTDQESLIVALCPTHAAIFGVKP